MSRYVDMLVKSIKEFPDKWLMGSSIGTLHCGGLRIGGIGNTKLLSCCCLYSEGVEVITTYTDRYKIEAAVLWWYKNCSLTNIIGAGSHG